MKKLLILLVFVVGAASAQTVNVVPMPTEIVPLKGKALVVKAVSVEQAMDRAATSVDPSLEQEEYRMTIDKAGVSIAGGSEQGVFWGKQTLRQLLIGNAVWTVKDGVRSAVFTLPTVKINDKPAFAYRGSMLDVARNFSDANDIKKYIDMLAMHKINTMHWHLTDDQGWRIQIKSHPELTSVGSVRAHTLIGHGGNPPFLYDGKPVAGCYTQDEVREIVKYAADRFIAVIPEIELPGHAEAALAAIPEIGCTGGPYEVWPRWGVNDEVFCAGNDKTFEVLEDVLAEVIDLFPSEYIHIGGDECPKTRWEACPKCQARMKAENLPDEHHLQSYFIQRIEKFVMSKGRNIIGWDEILEGGLSKTATVMSWRGVEGGIKAAQAGNKVIMTPNSFYYFDYYQAKPESEEPYGIGGYLPLEKTYSFNPYEGLTKEQQKSIIGVQGNLWREYIKTMDHTYYMLLPRLAAMAETGWSYPYNDFESFKHRLATMRVMYDMYGYKYAERDDQRAN